MLLAQRIKHQGVKVVTADLISPNKTLVWVASICVIVGAPVALILEPYAKASGAAGSGVLISVIVLFAWGLIQAPLYFGSLKLAIHNCENWLYDLEKHAPNPVSIELILNKNEESAVVLFKEQYGLEAISRNAEQMRRDISGQIASPRHWELMIRMLLDLAKEEVKAGNRQYSIDLCISLLMLEAIKDIDYGDRCTISIGIKGDVTVLLDRESGMRKSLQIGNIPIV